MPLDPARSSDRIKDEQGWRMSAPLPAAALGFRVLLRSPSSFILPLPVQLGRNHVQAAQHRHNVAERMPANQMRKNGEMDERRRSAAGTIGRGVPSPTR